MSGNSSGSGCRNRSHNGRGIEIYDALPREVRDKLKVARSNLCPGCVRNRLRREGLEATLRDLDFERRRRREKQGREVSYVLEEDLRL